jgi:hypothetical protein
MIGVGRQVRVRSTDPPYHTRVPRYVRGHIGTVRVVQPPALLPDDLVRKGCEARRLPVYTVAFTSGELWGEDGHEVLCDLWECYLEALDE